MTTLLTTASARQLGAAVRALLVLTLLLGVAYPLAVTGVGQALFHHQANGSMVRVGGRTVGSSLIGQPFTSASGAPLAQYFQPRPSAAGDGYDPTSTGASNLGPENPALVKLYRARIVAIAAFDGVAPDDVPPDAVQASGSGLDPGISPAYAEIQVARVARARGLTQAAVRRLVGQHTAGRPLGFLGEPAVDVLELNLALDTLGK